MREKVVVSYFKCNSSQGNELYQMIKNELENGGIHELEVEVVLRDNDTLAGRDAFMCDDVIIFDASLEGEDAGRQYDALMENMLISEYLLLVSRTILPFNVCGTWKGGYPRYLKAGAAYYQESLTNQEILSWVKTTLNRIKLPNPRKIRRREYYNLTLEDRLKALGVRTGMDYNTEEIGFRQPLQVFVSYCSRYSSYFSNQNSQKGDYTVEDLIRFISKTQGIHEDEIGYFPPGKLSRELMTLQRRWEVVSDTFKLIHVCSQFWILDTPDYWESWWTLSERVTLSYITTVWPERCPDIYIAKYNPKQQKFQVKSYLSMKEKRGFLPRIDRQNLRTIRLYFANSRTNSIGYVRDPEYIKSVMKCSSGLFPGSVQGVDEYKMTIAELKELLRPCRGHRPDSDNFWDDFILECPTCKRKNNHTCYSMTEFLYPQNTPFYHVVRKEEFQQDEQGGIHYTCPSCKRSFCFRPESYYRWMPMGMESVLGLPDAKLVERKEIYVFNMQTD